jgi:flagellar hook protein FlgE
MFQQGLSGLNAASKSLDVIGNNIANASTVGFKASQAQFADLYANSLNGVSGNNAGIGVTVSKLAQQFTRAISKPAIRWTWPSMVAASSAKW